MRQRASYSTSREPLPCSELLSWRLLRLHLLVGWCTQPSKDCSLCVLGELLSQCIEETTDIFEEHLEWDICSQALAVRVALPGVTTEPHPWIQLVSSARDLEV